MGGRVAIMLALFILFVMAVALVATAIYVHVKNMRQDTLLVELTEGERLREQYEQYMDRAVEAEESRNELLAIHLRRLAAQVKREAKRRGYDV